MTAYTFETITSAEAANYSASSDTLQFATPGANAWQASLVFSPATDWSLDYVTITVGSRSIDFGFGIHGSDARFPDGSLLFIGCPLAEDWWLGSASGDAMFGAGGDDSLTGLGGADRLQGNQGRDTLVGGQGDDWVVGGKDNDQLFGDTGDDIVNGNLGADTCSGGEGADIVRGGQANDLLDGGAGGDWLSGDLGDDTLTGGAGADVFYFFAGGGLDRVLDFSVADGDRVQVLPGQSYSLSQSGADTVIDLSGGGRLVLVGVQLSSLPGGWIFGA
ncbi:calcium-binding protein [Phenylobacterium sp. LjRoot225]|uniref:calcium-binding protein n=1 Tax=Phenylobacterium sp. LjRoot225 TaxID=3342285 RepID=UPI003ECF125D